MESSRHYKDINNLPSEEKLNTSWQDKLNEYWVSSKWSHKKSGTKRKKPLHSESLSKLHMHDKSPWGLKMAAYKSKDRSYAAATPKEGQLWSINTGYKHLQRSTRSFLTPTYKSGFQGKLNQTKSFSNLLNWKEKECNHEFVVLAETSIPKGMRGFSKRCQEYSKGCIDEQENEEIEEFYDPRIYEFEEDQGLY